LSSPQFVGGDSFAGKFQLNRYIRRIEEVFSVFPAKAGIQAPHGIWTPAFSGVTNQLVFKFKNDTQLFIPAKNLRERQC